MTSSQHLLAILPALLLLGSTAGACPRQKRPTSCRPGLVTTRPELTPQVMAYLRWLVDVDTYRTSVLREPESPHRQDGLALIAQGFAELRGLRSHEEEMGVHGAAVVP